MGLHSIVSRNNFGTVSLALTLSMFAAGCKKKVPPPAPPPPPAPVVRSAPPKPDAPTISSFEAEPSTIERGQAATLRWTVTGATTDVRIEPGIGTVNATGSRQVFPGNTTTYTLTATGPGGTASATASVNVTAPPPPPPRRSPASRTAHRVGMGRTRKCRTRCSTTTAARFGKMPAQCYRVTRKS